MTNPEMTELQTKIGFARHIARQVGDMALKFRRENGKDALGIKNKGPQDFVTEVDRKAEATIRSELAAAFPGDGMLGEEAGGATNTRHLWVVDPIDGTTNFLRGFHHWGVSIAYVSDGIVQGGVVYDAPHGCCYWAIRGQGAFRDEIRLRVYDSEDVSRALVVIGISGRTAFCDYTTLLERLNQAGIEHRRLGSAAIGLARVAEGVADAYFEASLNCWDALAGTLIASEAGAVLHQPPIDKFLEDAGPVLCGSPKLVSFLLQASPALISEANPTQTV